MLKEWMIAFNEAKTMETNGEEGMALIKEYERVLSEMGNGPYTDAEQHVREEVSRNLHELYLLNGDEEKAAAYSEFC